MPKHFIPRGPSDIKRRALESFKYCNRCDQYLLRTKFNKSRSFKDGLAWYCRKCSNEYVNEYNRTHPLEKKESMRKTHWNLKVEVIQHYGGICSCPPCGEKNIKFLTIDHPLNDGFKYRNMVGSNRQRSGDNLYRWLKRHNYPKGFRVQCYNCNCGRQNNSENPTVCPHMENVKSNV